MRSLEREREVLGCSITSRMGQKHSIDIEPYDPDALKNQDLQSLLEHISETERSKPSKFSDEEAAQELVQQLFKIDVSIERLYEAIPFEPLRSIRDSKPRVFVFILENLIEKLEGVILQGKIEGVAKNTAVLNVVRALTRFFVVMHEDPNSEVHPFLWVKPQKTSDQSEQTHQDPFKSNLPDDINVNSPEEFQKSCLAEKIVYTIINLLFINGFTIRSVDISKVGLKSDDYGTNMDESRVLYWESKGDSYNLDIVNNIDPNRIEVLRALLACLCQDLYITSSEYRHDRNPWVRIVVESEFYPSLRQVVSATTGEFHPAPRPSTLFWSLLNIVLNFNPNQRGIMGSFLPTALTDISSREVLVGLSIHLLLILVEFRYMKDYGPASKEQPVIKKDDDLDPADEPVTQNYYLALFRSIRRPKDLDDTLESIIRLLMINVNAAEKLGIGLKLFDAFEEIIILNWKLVEENSAYFKHILQMDSFIQLVRCILFYMYRYMDDSCKSQFKFAFDSGKLFSNSLLCSENWSVTCLCIDFVKT